VIELVTLFSVQHGTNIALVLVRNKSLFFSFVLSFFHNYMS